jgi:hypothetical protein
MSADNVLAEALARIEHKVDLILEASRILVGITQLGEKMQCPVCKQVVLYQVDQLAKVVLRKCGCKTGLHAPLDLSAFAPMASDKTRKDAPDGDDHEDGSNSPSNRRHRVR